MTRHDAPDGQDEARPDRKGLWIPIALFVIPALVIVVVYMVIRSLAAPG